MREKRKYIKNSDKTFVVAIGIGSDILYWHIIPSLVITCDDYSRRFKIALSFLTFWCYAWVRCDKKLKIKEL